MDDGLLGVGAAMLSRSQRRLEATTSNVANMATPGYKKQRIAEPFSKTLADLSVISRPITDFSQGTLKATGSPFDLSISGSGFFQLRDRDGNLFLSRSGQFSRGDAGRIIDGRGMALQSSDGTDLIVGAGTIEFSDNGIVLENGRPISRISLVQPQAGTTLASYSGSLFRADGLNLDEVEDAEIRQGKLESSNVEMSFEMTEIMGAMRQAETGSRIVQTFDALMGQTISTFGRSGK